MYYNNACIKLLFPAVKFMKRMKIECNKFGETFGRDLAFTNQPKFIIDHFRDIVSARCFISCDTSFEYTNFRLHVT